jgi:hypothetical protein
VVARLRGTPPSGAVGHDRPGTIEDTGTIKEAGADESAATPTTNRVEGFSDDVIAIAATLLVLDLHVPEPGQAIGASLGHQLPSLAAYAVSFLTILIPCRTGSLCCLPHHRLRKVRWVSP